MVQPRKRLGQHFLHHRAILERIVDALGAPAGAPVLEIGPGQGRLTRILAGRGQRVTAIEKDRDLAAAVAELLPQVRVVPGDALELDWREEAVRGAPCADPWFVIGNIPYNITSPLLAQALTPPRPARIVFLVQEEVAHRIVAAPGTREYGALSVGVQAVASAEKLFPVPAGAFHPPPRVDSAVVRLEPLGTPLVPDGQIAEFRRLVTGLFGFRRKQLGRGLRELTGMPAEDAAALLGRLGIPATARPETLTPSQFVALHRALIDGPRRTS